MVRTLAGREKVLLNAEDALAFGARLVLSVWGWGFESLGFGSLEFWV